MKKRKKAKKEKKERREDKEDGEAMPERKPLDDLDLARIVVEEEAERRKQKKKAKREAKRREEEEKAAETVDGVGNGTGMRKIENMGGRYINDVCTERKGVGMPRLNCKPQVACMLEC